MGNVQLAGLDQETVIWTVRIAGVDTGGAFALLEYHVPPYGAGLPAHAHAAAAEWVYVVEGMLAGSIDDQTITVKLGELVLVPPSAIHRFWNPAAAPARVLSLFAPAVAEEAELLPPPAPVPGPGP
jgi:quercetin dioxygenase-like cupin family protein